MENAKTRYDRRNRIMIRTRRPVLARNLARSMSLGIQKQSGRIPCGTRPEARIGLLCRFAHRLRWCGRLVAAQWLRQPAGGSKRLRDALGELGLLELEPCGRGFAALRLLVRIQRSDRKSVV